MSNYLVAGSRVTIETTIVERTGASTTAVVDLSAGGITGVDCLTKVDNGAWVETSASITDGPSGTITTTLPSVAVADGRQMKLQWRINSGSDPLLTKPIILRVL